MRTLLGICALAFSVVVAWQAAAEQSVRGYTRSNGTYVQPYHRSDPNGTVTDNWSYRGNTNPHTGKQGTNSYQHDLTSPYYTGPDSHGHVGHSGYGNYPGAITLSCPPATHMTARDGCQ